MLVITITKRSFPSNVRVKSLIKCLFIYLIVGLCLWTLFGYGHLRNYRYTWYYRYRTDERELHLQLNEQLTKAQIFWDELLKNNDVSFVQRSDLCTVLITSPGGSHPTLHFTLSSLINAMTTEDKLTRKIFLFNTARPSHLHRYAEQISRSHLPYLQVFNSSLSFHSDLYSEENRWNLSHDRWRWMEAIDYLTALSLCQSTYPRSILILEDDLIFTKDFFQKLPSVSDDLTHCAWIRLFKSDFWDGWEREDRTFLILLSMSVTALLLAIILFDKERQHHQLVWNWSLYSRLIILMVFWILYSLFILMIIVSTGRQNFQFLFGWRAGVHPIESSVPGTLAHLYPHWIIEPLRDFLHRRLTETLSSKKTIPIDLLLIEFLEERNTNFSQCHLVPDLVDHTGVYSSSLDKNQGTFKWMKQSGTFRLRDAAVDLTLTNKTMK